MHVLGVKIHTILGNMYPKLIYVLLDISILSKHAFRLLLPNISEIYPDFVRVWDI